MVSIPDLQINFRSKYTNGPWTVNRINWKNNNILERIFFLLNKISYNVFIAYKH